MFRFRDQKFTRCVQLLLVLLIGCCDLSRQVDAQTLRAESLPDIYLVHGDYTPAIRTASFAHWFSQQQFGSYEAALSVLGPLRLPLDRMMDKTGYMNQRNEFTDFALRLYYYSEQPARFREPLEAIIGETHPRVLEIWLNKMEQEQHLLWLSFTDKPGEFILCGRSSRPLKGRIHIQSFISNCLSTSAGPFVKSSGKGKKTVLGSSISEQRFFRNDPGEISFVVKVGKTYTNGMTLRALHSLPPVIHRFTSSKSPILEGEVIHLTWEVSGAEKVTIGPSIGESEPRWQIKTAPESSTTYRITANNDNGEVSSELHIEVERIYLTRVEATFMVPENGDQKESASVAIVDILNGSNEVVASIRCGDGTEYPADGSYQGPYVADVSKPVLKKSLNGGRFTVRLEGPVDDAWTFSPIIVLIYSDGNSESFFGYGTPLIRTGGDAFSVNF